MVPRRLYLYCIPFNLFLLKNQQKHVFVFVRTHVCMLEGREKEAIRTSLFARYSFESLKAKAFIQHVFKAPLFTNCSQKPFPLNRSRQVFQTIKQTGQVEAQREKRPSSLQPMRIITASYSRQAESDTVLKPKLKQD